MTKLSLFLVSLLLSSSYSFITTANGELCNPIDKNALLQIKYHMGPNASALSTWLPHTDCRLSWFGLGFDNVTNRVNYLTIGQSDEFSGQIPPEIGDLTGLQVLYFNDMPGLTGPIPSSISNLINLIDLEFTNTNLTGPIPSSWSRLTKLKILDFSENRLTGSIPASLSLLPNLQGLNLAKNQLSGSIPASFGSFKKLTFQGQENRLSGPIPRSLSQAGLTAVNVSSMDSTFNEMWFDLSKEETRLPLFKYEAPKQISELPKLTLICLMLAITGFVVRYPSLWWQGSGLVLSSITIVFVVLPCLLVTNLHKLTYTNSL